MDKNVSTTMKMCELSAINIVKIKIIQTLIQIERAGGFTKTH